MAHVSDEAICIRHWDFSETSQTVSLFTRGHGLLRGLAKGAKRVGGRFSGGIDLLTRGQVVAIVKPGRELSTLTDWTLLATYRSLRVRLDANQAGFYMIDLVQRLVADADPHPRLYDGLVAGLEAIDGSAEAARVLLAFQWLVLDETGVAPALRDPEDPSAALPTTVHFSPSSGGIARDGGWKVRRPTIELLRTIAEAEPADAGRAWVASALASSAGSEDETVGRANRLLAAYLRHVLGAFPETMRAIFPEP